MTEVEKWESDFFCVLAGHYAVLLLAAWPLQEEAFDHESIGAALVRALQYQYTAEDVAVAKAAVLKLQYHRLGVIEKIQRGEGGE